jgi:hypothetical protein
MECDPLLVLLDFMVGDSVDTLAAKNRLPHEHVEQALRAALTLYGFHAEREPRAEPPYALGAAGSPSA